MGSPRLGAAAGNALIAPVIEGIKAAGGNAVDACLAMGIQAWVAEPYMCSIGGSGFIAVRTPDGTVEIIDGNNTMPSAVPEQAGQGMLRVYFSDYANGMYTGIGAGAVAVPGILAAIHAAWERHGHLEWAALFESAIALARNGIAFPQTSAYYLSATFDELWSRFDEARALYTVDGRPLREGETLLQPRLRESLQMVADQGPGAFYGGELGDAIVERIEADHGLLSAEDLNNYTAEVRSPIHSDAFGWRVDTNPPPSVGGAVLTHMLALLQEADMKDPVLRTLALVQAEEAAIGYRLEHYEDPGEIASGLEDALARLKARGAGPASTTHHSAADTDGYVCSLTQSNGYSSGLVVRGMLLNNTLGEEELNPRGAHGLPPGSRCHSNMTPTIVSGGGITVGLGSPGADRIVGAIAQSFIGLAVDRLSLADAIGAPRVHLSHRADGDLLCFEPGIPGDDLGYASRPYDDLHMFFGGVNGVAISEEGELQAVHDPRRSGSSVIV